MYAVDILDKCATRNNVSDLDGKPNYFFCQGDITNRDLVPTPPPLHSPTTVRFGRPESSPLTLTVPSIICRSLT